MHVVGETESELHTQRCAVQGTYKKYYKSRSTIYSVKKISICKILIIWFFSSSVKELSTWILCNSKAEFTKSLVRRKQCFSFSIFQRISEKTNIGFDYSNGYLQVLQHSLHRPSFVYCKQDHECLRKLKQVKYWKTNTKFYLFNPKFCLIFLVLGLIEFLSVFKFCASLVSFNLLPSFY